MAEKATHKVALRPLDIGNARAYNRGDLVLVEVVNEHFSGEDFADAVAGVDSAAGKAALGVSDEPADNVSAVPAVASPTGSTGGK
jgi:hypothetical protein